MASRNNLIYLEVSNATGEGVSRLFEVALIEAVQVQNERENKVDDREEEDKDDAEEKNRTSKVCAII